MGRECDETAASVHAPDCSPDADRSAASRAPGRRYELLLMPGTEGLRRALHQVAALIGYPVMDPDPVKPDVETPTGDQ